MTLAFIPGGRTISVHEPGSVLHECGALEVARGDIHLWAFSLDLDAGAIGHCWKVLSSRERTCAYRFVYEKDRNRFVLAHGLVRHMLARYLDTSAESISFDAGPAGKPKLKGHSHRISFNLSHSSARAVVAVSDGRDVGVDVEQERRDVDVLAISRTSFFRSEFEAICSAPPAQRYSVFFRYWVAKEAVLKGEGFGLGVPLDQFEVLFTGDNDSALVRSFDKARLRADWTVRMLSLGQGWPVAVSALGQEWRLSIAGAQG